METLFCFVDDYAKCPEGGFWGQTQMLTPRQGIWKGFIKEVAFKTGLEI